MSLRRATLWSLCDQILLSGVHFALGLVVLRLTDKPQYGLYVLSWAVLLLLTGLQNAFIGTQLTVRAAGLPADEQQRSCGTFLIGQTLSYTALLLVTLAVAATLLLWTDAREAALTMSATAIAFAGCGLREFARSSLLLRAEVRRVLKIDLAYAATLIASTAAAAWLLPSSWLAPAVILALGIASAVASLPFIRAVIAHAPPLPLALREFRQSLGAGTWAAGGVVVTHIQSQSYVYLLSAVAGLAVTAEASAARLLIMPVSLAFTSMQRVLYPQWVIAARNTSSAQLQRSAWQILAVATLAVVAYAAALAALAELIVPTLMGTAYRASAGYIGLFAFLVWAEIVRSIFSLQLQANARFRIITACNVVTAALTVAVALPAIGSFGPGAAIAVQGAGDLLLAALLFGYLRRERWRGHDMASRASFDSAASR